jgi:hypothetical protein
MAKHIHNWRRYWVPRDGAFSYDSEGFLLPPASDAKWARWWKTDAVNIESLSRKPCLVLLGEPGIGKTFAINDVANHERISRQGSGASFLVLNLGSYSNELLLISELFGSREFKNWHSNGGELHIFLDSFDECLLRLDTVASLLKDRFSNLANVQGLFLRITSRTAEWRTFLEDSFRKIWGDNSVGVYELAPLTREQVELAATNCLSDAEAFIHEVIKSEVVSFAIKPLTLDLLIRIWEKRGGSLPPSQREIYEQGCFELCTENPERNTPKLQRQHSAAELMAVSAQIFAVMMFCKRSAVWIGSRHVDKLENDISLSELAEGSINSKGQELRITENLIREALNTGLFNSRGPDRLSWAHQTYAEFLAARYISSQGFQTNQIFDLLTHRGDGEGKLVPQLQETAAWIAGANKEVFRHLLCSQPEVLLRSDVATADDLSKQSLIDSLIVAFEEDSVHGDWLAMRARYKKLYHSHVSSQLRLYLQKRELAVGTRVEVIRMAEACGVKELIPDLIRLALSKEESQQEREWAALAVDRIGTSQQKAQLKPLVHEKEIDPEDHLIGIALRACWPDHISAEELFHSIRPPRRSGVYKSFITTYLGESLKEEHLLTALAWAEAQPEQHALEDGGYASLIIKILENATQYIDVDEVCNALAKTLLSRLKKHEFSMGHEGQILRELSKERRLKLAEAVCGVFEDNKTDPLFITRSGIPLITQQDINWLLDRIYSANSPDLQAKLCAVMGWIFYPNEAKQVDIVIEAARNLPALMETLGAWFRPVVLDSEEGQKLKNSHIEYLSLNERIQKKRERKKLVPSPAEQILSLLEKFEAGDLDAWWKLTQMTEIEDDGRYAEGHFNLDIRDLPGWKNSANETRLRLLNAAVRYVNESNANPTAWFKRENIAYHPAISGSRALLLLANEAPSAFSKLSSDVWKRWVSIVMSQQYYGELEHHRLLVAKTLEFIPREAEDWLVQVLEKENKEGENLWVLSKLPERWSDDIGKLLLQCAKEKSFKPQCVRQLLTALVEHKVTGSIELLRASIRSKIPSKKDRRAEVLFASTLLMLHGDYQDWLRIKTLIYQQSSFGRELMEVFAHDYDRNSSPVLRTLLEADVASLWEWMVVQYPVAEDPDRSQGGEVTTRWGMANFRDSLIRHLAELGTTQACRELTKLTEKYTNIAWLRYELVRAKSHMRQRTWCPPLPGHLFGLAKNRRGRLVQSADQLLDAVKESLLILQQKHHAETPRGQFLWDGDRPKPEESISDWVKAHLEDDLKHQGVIFGREVQIHQFENTDIHIEAVVRDEKGGIFDTVKLIIEVKGCWNRELKTSMKSQLTDRYLANNDCTHGIYLVGWFVCPAWTDKDYRRGDVRFKSIIELERYLTQQAESLSTGQRKIHWFVLDACILSPKSKRKPKRN